jgi:type II secretory pathway component GspD/PulD (secretin)
MMSVQSTALPEEDDVTVLSDKTVLRLSAPARSDPLPVFQVDEVSLASASIHDALRMIVGRNRVSYSIARAMDGSPSQFGTVTAYQLGGSFSQVLESLSRSMGFFYTYREGVLEITPEAQFFFTLPPVEDAFGGIQATLQAMGARGISLDKGARAVSFRASRPVVEAVRGYLDYIRENRAIVTYDAWIYEVILADTNNGGVAWNKFRVGVDNNYGGNSANISGTAAQPTEGLGISLVYNSRYFNLDLFVKFLRSQGTLRTLSQPKLALLSGTKGQIKAGRKVVYVSQVGQTSTGITTSTSTQTAELQTGVDMTLTTNVDEGTIFTEVKLKADELNQFNVFTALGTQLQLPDTSAREIATTVRSRAGDVVLLGGITVAREQNDRSGFPLFGAANILPTAFNASIQRSELVIVLRPRIIRFSGQDTSKRQYSVADHGLPLALESNLPKQLPALPAPLGERRQKYLSGSAGEWK